MYIVYALVLFAGQAIAADFTALCTDPKLKALQNFMVLCEAFQSFSDGLNGVPLDPKVHREHFIRYGRDVSEGEQEHALENTSPLTTRKRHAEGYMRFGRSVKGQPAGTEKDKKGESKKAIPSTADSAEVREKVKELEEKDKRYMRFGRNDYIRFGRESEEQDDNEIDEAKRYMRFGKKSDDEQKRYMRFGKKSYGPVSEDNNDDVKRYMRFGKKSYGPVSEDNNDDEKRYMRFGKKSFGPVSEDDNDDEKRYMRFGKRDDEKRYMRFGKRYMRFGKKDDALTANKKYMRFGKRGDDEESDMAGDADKRYMRFGKKYMRFGKRYMRFGRDSGDEGLGDAEEKRYMRFGKRYMRFGKRDTTNADGRVRKARSTDEVQPPQKKRVVREAGDSEPFERLVRDMRFGRNPNGATVDGYIRFGRLLDGEEGDSTEDTPEKRYMRFGRDYLRFGRLTDEDEADNQDNTVQKRFVRFSRLFGGLGRSKEELQRRYFRNNRDRTGGYLRFGRSEPAGGYMRFGK